MAMPPSKNDRGTPQSGLHACLLSRSHCTAFLSSLSLGTDPKIDPSEKKLLLVESMRFRILEIDLQGLLPEAPAHGSPPPSLAAGLAFCGEDETLPKGVRIFTSSLPGVCVCIFFGGSVHACNAFDAPAWQ